MVPGLLSSAVSTVCLQISPPKTDIENNVIISDYAQMDRILKVGCLNSP